MQQNQEFMTNKLLPISLGQILLEEFMEPMGISQSKLARDIDVPVTRSIISLNIIVQLSLIRHCV
ncbi:hypothetical protein KNCP2_10480 [Candidatus Rickettsia kedanie]|uniref:HTH cro/C1-type domain-containing protein n=1 Tax=Candidatus Rickettsia kedanie TaxID=3115352 RepID=A0ABP9TVI6_9RICK